MVKVAYAVAWLLAPAVILPPNRPVPLTVKKPNLPADSVPVVPATGDICFTENFDSDKLAFRWIGLRAPTSKWWVVSKAAKALFLEPRGEFLSGRAVSRA